MPATNSSEGQSKPEPKVSFMTYVILIAIIYFLYSWLLHIIVGDSKASVPPPAPTSTSPVVQSPVAKPVQNMSPIAPIEETKTTEAPFAIRKQEVQTLLDEILLSTKEADYAIENWGIGAYKLANAWVKIEGTLRTLRKIVIPDNLEAEDKENLKDGIQWLLGWYGKKNEAMKSAIRAVAKNDMDEATAFSRLMDDGNTLVMTGLRKIADVARKYSVTVE